MLTGIIARLAQTRLWQNWWRHSLPEHLPGFHHEGASVFFQSGDAFPISSQVRI
jgi:hypothetical protein